MKILLAVDGSQHSLFAEQVVQGFPFGTSLELEVVTVCPSADLHALGPDIPPVVNTMVDDCRKSSLELLATSKERCLPWAETVETTLLDGHAAHEILQLIETSQPQLVVLGSHGYGAIKGFLLGSVSDRIASHAHCPVLITRDHEQTSEVKNILIADDGSEQAAAAVKRFAGFSLNDCAIELVAVLETVGTYGMDEILLSSADWQEHRRQIEDRLAQHQALLKASGAEVKVTVLQATNVVDALTRHAQKASTDLIVVGSTGKSGMSKFLLGSVSLRTLHHSPCSIWIERTKEKTPESHSRCAY